MSVNIGAPAEKVILMQTRPILIVATVIQKWSINHAFYLMLVFIFMFMEWSQNSLAQGDTPSVGNASAPSLGGAGGMRPPAPVPLLNGSQNAAVKMHLGPTGKRCLTVVGYAQPQIINANIYDHMISASNDCSQPIKMQVCYYQTQQCIPFSVPAYGRKEAVLGIMPAMKQFRFEYREDFNQGIGSGTTFN